MMLWYNYIVEFTQVTTSLFSSPPTWAIISPFSLRLQQGQPSPCYDADREKRLDVEWCGAVVPPPSLHQWWRTWCWWIQLPNEFAQNSGTPPVAESFTKDRNNDVRKSQKYQMNVKIWKVRKSLCMLGYWLPAALPWDYVRPLQEHLAQHSTTLRCLIFWWRLLQLRRPCGDCSACVRKVYVCVCVSEPHQSVMKEFLKIKRKFHAGPSSLRGRTRSQAPFNLL